MSLINCLRCQTPIESSNDACPHCNERVTQFQRTYAGKLLDGKYQILERLGVGGMGEIFKVRHIHLNEQRVIKIMRSNIATDDQALQRFLHEARTSTMIKHRNLAMLYDFSTLDDGSYYMVWEFIEGTNIQKWMSRHGAVPPRLALEIAIQALEGLEHLHTMGLIHRDISPENIMLSQDYQGKLLVKVIDFGIAKQLSEGEGGQGLTQTGMFLGKLKYASPEQAGFIKEGEHLDARSDLYSFGVVLYEMLAGRAPFNASNPHGYILKHATEKPLPFAQFNPDVQIPPRLEAEVLRALEKDRDTRHASAAEFATALAALRDVVLWDEKASSADWRVTLSAQKTLVDPTRPGRTAPGGTGPAPTVTGPSEPTLVTRSGGADATMVDYVTGKHAGDRTVIERQPTVAGSADATVIEKMTGGAEATALEPKFAGTAQATVIDQDLASLRGEAPAKKRNRLPLIAAAALIPIIVALVLIFKPGSTTPPAGQPVATTTSTAAPAVTETGVAPSTTQEVSAAPITAGAGEIQLVASPYGVVQRVENLDTSADVELAGGDFSTPLRLELPPGRYRLHVAGPKNERQTVDVTLAANAREMPRITFDQPNLDDVYEEVFKP